MYKMCRLVVRHKTPGRGSSSLFSCAKNDSGEGEAGFSYIEVLVSSVILSIGVLALTQFQVTTAGENNSSSMRTTAVSLLEKKVESLKSLPFAGVQSEAPSTLIESGGTFTRQVTVTNNSPFLNTKTVNVSVSWVSGGSTRAARITTIIAQ
jgi:type IV pilus assembly protein PilV